MESRFTQLARRFSAPSWLYAPQNGDDRNMTRGMIDGFGVGIVEGVRIFIPVLLTIKVMSSLLILTFPRKLTITIIVIWLFVTLYAKSTDKMPR